MPTFTALTTLTGKAAAEALGEAMERLTPEPAAQPRRCATNVRRQPCPPLPP